MTFFWLLLLAHGVADFILQTNSISSAKCNNQWQGYLYHGMGIFFCTLIAVHFFGWWTAVAAASIITLAHILVDWLKNISSLKIAKIMGTGTQPGLIGFLVDQILHIFVLLWAWHLLDISVDATVASFYGTALSPVYSIAQSLNLDTVVPVITIFILVSFGGNLLIRMALDQLQPSDIDFREGTPAGKYIGILERMLIMTLAAADSLSAIGFVFAAKSLARFNAISENRQFAEYYLIGTLLSFFLALAAGLLLRHL